MPLWYGERMRQKQPKDTRLSLLLPAKLKRQLQHEVAQGKRVISHWSLKSEILDRLEWSFSDPSRASLPLQMDKFNQVLSDLYAENKRLRLRLRKRIRGSVMILDQGRDYVQPDSKANGGE